jgi:hypothetical protein
MSPFAIVINIYDSGYYIHTQKSAGVSTIALCLISTIAIVVIKHVIRYSRHYHHNLECQQFQCHCHKKSHQMVQYFLSWPK